jgi:hypothetical protein
MKKVLILIQTLLIILAVANEEVPRRDLDWALDIARNVAVDAGLSPTAALLIIQGAGLDRSGELTMDYESPQWMFGFADDSMSISVFVYYDGDVKSEPKSAQFDVLFELPNSGYHYVFVSNFTNWFKTALSIFDKYLDEGDYFYAALVRWLSDGECVAYFCCYELVESLAEFRGGVSINAETGNVIGHAWE